MAEAQVRLESTHQFVESTHQFGWQVVVIVYYRVRVTLRVVWVRAGLGHRSGPAADAQRAPR
jgi:hypothetical protein